MLIKQLLNLNIPPKYKYEIMKTVDSILDKYPDVLKIILFGSCAREKVIKGQSDIDICVIMDYTNEERDKIESYLHWDMFDNLYDNIDKQLGCTNYVIEDQDVLLYSPEFFKQCLLSDTTVTKYIQEEGVILYEKQQLNTVLTNKGNT